MRRHLEAGQVFDMSMTHDVIKPSALDPTRKIRAYKVGSTGELVETKKYLWKFPIGSSWSQTVNLRSNDGKNQEVITVKAPTSYELLQILTVIREIAEKEDAARQLNESPDRNLWMFQLGIGSLRENAQALRSELLKKSIVLPP